MTHEQHARAFLAWHRRRGCDVRDDWGAWLRTHRCDAAAVWRIVRDEVASEGVAGEDVWEAAA